LTDIPGKADRPKVPNFDSEAAEGLWWDKNKPLMEASLL
jgi:hypothetical protein